MWQKSHGKCKFLDLGETFGGFLPLAVKYIFVKIMLNCKPSTFRKVYVCRIENYEFERQSSTPQSTNKIYVTNNQSIVDEYLCNKLWIIRFPSTGEIGVIWRIAIVHFASRPVISSHWLKVLSGQRPDRVAYWFRQWHVTGSDYWKNTLPEFIFTKFFSVATGWISAHGCQTILATGKIQHLFNVFWGRKIIR